MGDPLGCFTSCRQMEAHVDCQMHLILLLWCTQTHTLNNRYYTALHTQSCENLQPQRTTRSNKQQGCALQSLYYALHLLLCSVFEPSSSIPNLDLKLSFFFFTHKIQFICPEDRFEPFLLRHFRRLSVKLHSVKHFQTSLLSHQPCYFLSEMKYYIINLNVKQFSKIAVPQSLLACM